jgi:hypothetical protein
MMRIYAAADIHGKKEKIRVIRRSITRYSPDLVILAGDISGRFNMESTVRELETMGVDLLFVAGNGDPASFGPRISESIRFRPLHMKRVEIGGMTFVGVNGTLAVPFWSMIALNESEILKQVAGLIDKNTFLVAHPPPRGRLDQVFGKFHAGSRGLERLIEETSPAAMICGHIHESSGITKIGATFVVNCALSKTSNGVLIDLSPGGRPECKMISA